MKAYNTRSCSRKRVRPPYVLFLYISAVLLRMTAALQSHLDTGFKNPSYGAPARDYANKKEATSLYHTGDDASENDWHLAPFHEIVGSHLTNPRSHHCEPISLTLCKGMEYQHTRMPNMFNHETQEEAGLEAHQFYPLVQINCSEDLRFFLCSIYTPICIQGYPSFLPPCRSICERVKAGCAPVMQHYNFPWPERMNCAQFPEYNNNDGVLCMERNLTGSESHTDRPVNLEPPVNSYEEKTTKKPDTIIQMTRPVEVGIPLMSPVNQFEAEATQVLLAFARQNASVEQMLNQRPGIRLECSCRCKPPAYKWPESKTEDRTTTPLVDCEMPCHSLKTSRSPNASAQFTTFWLSFWSILCLASTMTTIFTFLLDSSRFQYPELPIVYLSTCYFMVSIGYLIRVMLGHESVACELMSQPPNYTTQFADLSMTNEVIPASWTSVLEQSILSSAQFSGSSTPYSRLKVLRHASTGRAGCAAVFLFTYFFSIASAVWWVILTLTWLLAAGLKWGSEAISKYSQVFHFIAWSIPTALSALALLLSVIEGDPVSGLCVIQKSKSLPYVLFLFAPMVILLATGILFLVIGFIALFRIRGAIKLQRINLHKTDRLEHLMTRIGTFALLYTVPNLVVIICMGYEIQTARALEYGVACACQFTDTLFNPLAGEASSLPEWQPPSPAYRIFMLEHFMHLIIGVTSGFWIWSRKTLDTWRHVCQRICGSKQRRQNGTIRLIPKTNLNESDGSSKTQFVPWTLNGLAIEHDLSQKSTPKKSVHENVSEVRLPSTPIQTPGAQSRSTPSHPIRSVHYDTNALNTAPYLINKIDQNEGYSLIDESRHQLWSPSFATNGGALCNKDPFLLSLPQVPPRSSLYPSASHTSGFQASPTKSTHLSPTNLSGLSSSGIGSANATNFAFDLHSQGHGTTLLTDLSDTATKSGSELSNTVNAEPARRTEGIPCSWQVDLTGTHNPFKSTTSINFAKANYGRGEGNLSQPSLTEPGYYQPVGSVYAKANALTQLEDVQPVRSHPDGEPNVSCTGSWMHSMEQGLSYSHQRTSGRLSFQNI